MLTIKRYIICSRRAVAAAAVAQLRVSISREMMDYRRPTEPRMMITKVNQSTIMRRNFHSPAHYFCYHYYLATIVNTAEDANQERERNYYRTVDQKRLRKVAFSFSLLYGTDAMYFFSMVQVRPFFPRPLVLICSNLTSHEKLSTFGWKTTASLGSTLLSLTSFKAVWPEVVAATKRLVVVVVVLKSACPVSISRPFLSRSSYFEEEEEGERGGKGGESSGGWPSQYRDTTTTVIVAAEAI